MVNAIGSALQASSTSQVAVASETAGSLSEATDNKWPEGFSSRCSKINEFAAGNYDVPGFMLANAFGLGEGMYSSVMGGRPDSGTDGCARKVVVIQNPGDYLNQGSREYFAEIKTRTDRNGNKLDVYEMNLQHELNSGVEQGWSLTATCGHIDSAPTTRAQISQSAFNFPADDGIDLDLQETGSQDPDLGLENFKGSRRVETSTSQPDGAYRCVLSGHTATKRGTSEQRRFEINLDQLPDGTLQASCDEDSDCNFDAGKTLSFNNVGEAFATLTGHNPELPFEASQVGEGSMLSQATNAVSNFIGSFGSTFGITEGVSTVTKSVANTLSGITDGGSTSQTSGKKHSVNHARAETIAMVEVVAVYAILALGGYIAYRGIKSLANYCCAKKVNLPSQKEARAQRAAG